MSAPVEISEAATAWETVRAFAESKGWRIELTPRGRTKCTKAGSVVFGPGHGAGVEHYHELIRRLGHIDGYMARRP